MFMVFCRRRRYLVAMTDGTLPLVSAVLTIYNKAPFLPATIRSLRRQMTDEREVEYVFVDDVSTDGSIDIVSDHMKDAPHVRIITNQDNCGPSIRLNQGARAARAPLLYLIDGDDIAAKGAMVGMLRLLEQEQSDVIYGKTEKRRASLDDLMTTASDPAAGYIVSDRPLDYIMKGGFVRMALMCKRSLFLEVGGADERIFVQDESLPLRLCAKAKRFIDWQATVISMQQAPPDEAGRQPVIRVSNDKTQLHHDGFLAFANALDETSESHPDLAPKLYAKAVSAYWKYARRQDGPAWLQSGFWRYLEAKCLRPSPRPEVLAWMKAEFLGLPNIRRP